MALRVLTAPTRYCYHYHYCYYSLQSYDWHPLSGKWLRLLNYPARKIRDAILPNASP